MNCPKCNHPLSRNKSQVSGGGNAMPVYYCENCGWGRERLEAGEVDQTAVAAEVPDFAAAAWLKLAGLWGLSAALVIAPYVLLVKSPFLFGGADPGVFDAQAASARMAAALNPYYWIVVFAYILICATFNAPEVNRHDMGWFGGLVDNPFSYSDDANRTKLLILLLMVPGKIILVTLSATYRLIRAVTAA